MMKNFFCMFVIIISLNAVVEAGLENAHIKIQYYEIDENGEDLLIGSSGWNLSKAKTINSIYTKNSNNGSGISGGSYVDQDNLTFEMPYHLRITEHPDKLLLRGIFRGINLDGERIISGIRKIIYEEIEYNKPIEIIIKPDEDSPTTKIIITLMKEAPKTEVVFNGPITLVTNFLNNSGCVTNTQGVITEKVEFSTGNGKMRDDGYVEQAKIYTEILLPNYPENLDEPFQAELTFRRIYKIDTLYVSERAFSVDVTYSSEYKEKIELISGKLLMLVFPADTPSVRGLDRIDTLYIRP